MNKDEMTYLINQDAHEDDPKFYGDYHAVFGLSDEELNRILGAVKSAAGFYGIYEETSWWTDENNLDNRFENEYK